MFTNGRNGEHPRLSSRNGEDVVSHISHLFQVHSVILMASRMTVDLSILSTHRRPHPTIRRCRWNVNNFAHFSDQPTLSPVLARLLAYRTRRAASWLANSAATGLCSRSPARCTGVFPFLLVAEMLAPQSSSTWTTATCPRSAAW